MRAGGSPTPRSEGSLGDIAVVPKRSLPAANGAIVAADGAMPDHVIAIEIGANLQHARTCAPPRPAATSQRDRLIVVRSLCNDVREILCQIARRLWRVEECSRRRQVVPKIHDPRIGHDRLLPFQRWQRPPLLEGSGNLPPATAYRHSCAVDLGSISAASAQLAQ